MQIETGNKIYQSFQSNQSSNHPGASSISEMENAINSILTDDSPKKRIKICYSEEVDEFFKPLNQEKNNPPSNPGYDNDQYRSDKPRNRYPCKYYMRGHCSNGENCHFEHVKSSVNGGSSGGTTSKYQSDRQPTNHSSGGYPSNKHYHHNGPYIPNDQKYKTSLCNRWKQGGNCSYGQNCNFAHGEAELRNHNGVSDSTGPVSNSDFNKPSSTSALNEY